MLAERVKKLRLSRGLSQTELSKISGVAEGLISGIESGKNREVTTTTLKKLAKAFRCKMFELID